MQPWKIFFNLPFISSGSVQLLVGPASSFVFEQIKVRSSIRATSLGCDRARKHPGRFSELSRIKVPFWTISSQRESYSDFEPSHQTIRAASQRAAISRTHPRSGSFDISVSPNISTV